MSALNFRASWISRSPIARQPANIALAVLFGVVASFYFWTAGSSAVLTSTSLDYFNLQTDAFLHHQVALLVKPTKELLDLKDPYDPAQSHAVEKLHDALLYKGRYYIYWGVTPLLLLYLPVRVLTGKYVSDRFASPLFASLGLLFYLLLVCSIRSDYFRESSPWINVAVFLLLAFGNMAPFILRRPAIYEVTITCGYLVTAVFFNFIYQAAFSGPLKLNFLFGASVALGLSFVTRPNLAACGLVLVAVCYLFRYRTMRPSVGWIKFLCVAWLPAGFFVAGQALYNDLRFGSVSNYGTIFQLAGVKVSDVTVFSTPRIPYDALYYLFATPNTSPLFPFFLPGYGPGVLHGPFRSALEALAPFVPLSEVEPTVGLLVVVPAALLLLIAPAFLFLKSEPRVRLWFLAVFSCGLATALITASFGGPTMRYEMDFVPQFLLLLGILIFWMLRSVKINPVRIGLTIGMFIAALYTVTISSALSITGYDDSFHGGYPDQYDRLVRLFSPVELLMVRPNDYLGVLEFHLRVPECAHANIGQPLVTSGSAEYGDFLILSCSGKRGYVIGWNHWGVPTKLGPIFSVPKDRPISVEIRAPFLFPPIDKKNGRLVFAPQACSVLVNGRQVFHIAPCATYQSDASKVFVLTNPIGGGVAAERYSAGVLSITYSGTI